jgi:HEAT repeat protein
VSEASAAVRWLLQQAEPEARRVAVQQIAKVPARDAPELLLRALGDNDWRVRKDGAAIAATLDRREEVVTALVAALEETANIGLRNAAVEALIAVGPDAVAAVVEALARIDADARKLAVEVLASVPDVRGASALVHCLSDPDGNVRVAAAEALGNAAPAGEKSRNLATQALVGSLATGDTFLTIAALDSLARLDARLPWALLEPYSRDRLLRRYALAAAALSREPEAVRALVEATGDPTSTIAREAIVALGDLVVTRAAEAALLEVARAALRLAPAGQLNARRAARNASDTRARAAALGVLGLLRDVADVAILVEALAEDDVAERADFALRLFGPSSVTPLLASARLARPRVRVSAFALVVSLEGADLATVRAALRQGLEDGSAEVVAAAVKALGPLGEAEDLRRIAPAVGHEDERIAATATNAVSELAERHVDAARALLEESAAAPDPLGLGCILLGAIASTQSLRDDDVRLLERALAHDRPRVRRAAIDALARSGGEAAADAVVFALADEESEVKLAAVRSLGRLRRPEPLARVVAHARDPLITATALRALGEADPERALLAARPLVTHADAAIACAAVEAVGWLAAPRGPAHLAPACEDALFAALDHPDAEVVKLALSLAGARRGARALARLGLCLDHASWEVRRVAAELLGQDKSASAQALLHARYEREQDPLVRDAISAAVSVRPSMETARPPKRED